MNIQDLDAALKAVCPVLGVSVGNQNDKTTWRVNFAPEATATQKQAAQAVIDGFDFSAVSPDAARLAAIDTTIAGDTVIAQLKAMTNAEFDTWLAANVTNAAQAISLLKRVTRVVLRRVC